MSFIVIVAVFCCCRHRCCFLCFFLVYLRAYRGRALSKTKKRYGTIAVKTAIFLWISTRSILFSLKSQSILCGILQILKNKRILQNVSFSQTNSEVQFTFWAYFLDFSPKMCIIKTSKNKTDKQPNSKILYPNS